MPSQSRGSSQTVVDHDTVSQLLLDLRAGDQDALNQLLPLVYHQLHALAQQQRRRWTGDETLDTTALVHEAYLKLADQSTVVWNTVWSTTPSSAVVTSGAATAPGYPYTKSKRRSRPASIQRTREARR